MPEDDLRPIKRPPGWTARAWATRLEYLAGQIEADAERFGPKERHKKLKLAARFRAAAKRERGGDEPRTDSGTHE